MSKQNKRDTRPNYKALQHKATKSMRLSCFFLLLRHKTPRLHDWSWIASRRSFSEVGLALILCMLLNSCGTNRPAKPGRQIVKQLKQDAHDRPLDFVRQQEAKLSDIPLALSLQPLADFCMQPTSPDTIILGYESMLSVNDLITFYHREMERCGWRLLTQFQGHETLLTFEKPRRICTISIRPDAETNKTEMVIFAGKKELCI